MSHASLPPRRPPPPRLPLPLTSLTFASRSSSACLALLIGVLPALAARGSSFASVFGAGAGFAAATSLRALRSGFFAAMGFRAARSLALRRLTTLAFFLAARTFFTLLRFWTILPPVNYLKSREKTNRTLYGTAYALGSAPWSLL